VCVPGFNDSPESLVTLADQALYQAKHEGRNRTILAEDVVAAE
jgi:PleD family two-component response regulator